MIKVNHKRLIPFAWVLTSIAIFLLCFNVCMANDGNCFHAGNYMLVCMMFLTFPCGLIYLLIVGLFFGSVDAHDPASYFLLWLGAFAAGYFQWFVLLPRLAGRQQITTLSIGPGSTVAKKGRQGRRRARKKRRSRILPARFDGHMVEQWDEAGHSPLERVINDRPVSF
jgi:hypothetical protein